MSAIVTKVVEDVSAAERWSTFPPYSMLLFNSTSYMFFSDNDSSDFWSEAPDSFTKYSTADYDIFIPTTFKIILGVFMVLLILVAMIGNSVVCYIVYQRKTMRSAINLLLANLAFSNVLLAVLCMPFSLATLIIEDWILGDIMCKVVGFFQSLFISVDVLMLLAISVHRYMIIVIKKDTLTPSRARITICVSWLCTVLLSLPPTVGWSEYTYYTGWMTCTLRQFTSVPDKTYVVLYHTVVFFLPTTVLTFCFMSIIRVVHRRRHRIHSQSPDLVLPTPKRGLSVSSLPRVSIDMNLKIRAFKTICILSALFVMCWLPYGVCITLWNLNHDTVSRYIGGNIVTFLGYLNCALNPVIYFVRIRKFRQACLEMIPKSVRGLPPCPSNAKRRINPATAYEYSDHPQSQQQQGCAELQQQQKGCTQLQKQQKRCTQLQQLQVESYIQQSQSTSV